MNPNYQNFIAAIHKIVCVHLTFRSDTKGQITRKCIPFDFGPSNRGRNDDDRYHFYTLNSPDGNHNLSIEPEKVISIEMTEEKFSPEEYVKWEPEWYVPRNWGDFS